MKSLEKITITPTQDFFGLIEHKHLLLDTCFFIDCLLHPSEFRAFVDSMRSSGAAFVTCEPVSIEFSKGIDSLKLPVRRQLIESIIDGILPFHTSIFEEHIPALIERYSKEGSKLSEVDFYLGALVRRHQRDLLLLSKNLQDFPTNIFDRKAEVLIKFRKTIHVYGLFSYNEG